MHILRSLRAALSLGIAAACLCGAATALDIQVIEQKPPLIQRTTPVYATHKDGTPVTNLTSSDIDILVGGGPVEGFTLAQGGSRNKLVFLVFDTATINSNLLSKSKKIAEQTVSQADGQVRFIVLSIDPGAGLRPVCGPSTDKKFILNTMAKSIVSKQSEYFRSRATSDTASGTPIPRGVTTHRPRWPKKEISATSSRTGRSAPSSSPQCGP